MYFFFYMKLSTRDIKRKNPINRNNFFFSNDQFNFQLGFSMEYINKVLNQTVVLYEIDREQTKSDDIYKEAKFKDLVFKTPIELNCMYNLMGSELKTYNSQIIKGYYVKVGKLSFQIMQKELDENNCDIHRGDYIGLQVTPEHMEFFIVADDGRVNYDNKHTLYGLEPYYRNITCTTVSDVTETQNL